MNICTDALDRLYKELKPRGVTMSALIAKACGVALASHPRLFASCTPDGKGMTYGERINIANAVAMPDGGLITPVLKDADTTDIYSMSRQWKDLVKRARGKQARRSSVWCRLVPCAVPRSTEWDAACAHTSWPAVWAANREARLRGAEDAALSPSIEHSKDITSRVA